ncbi:M56 family peptidase [Actinomadura logoneensis]|uniref:M56 family peptidase n=1 Tax=Actinomadura logoneensis TaxID=2293572 RepID=A0A372JKA1_9ACTN|nr:M56 family metallopeptidase [Actinomadura logoneensis]RFU40236.1 M56 family peptidase [Actinomadura logoneensis]
MNPFTFLPVAATLPLAFALGRLRVPLHPAWTARILVTVAATATTSAVGTVLFVAVNYGATLAPGTADRLPEWMLFGDDQPVPAELGVPALLLFACACVAIAFVLVRSARATRRARRLARGVLDVDEPLAVAVPGRRDGGVLVSRGLLRLLDGPELAVVFRHEESHLRHAHHRYLLIGALTAAVLPPLRPLDARLRLALERWADEDTAAATGDRALVARTIAKVALAAAPAGGPDGLPSFAQAQTVERVRALLTAPPRSNSVTGPVALLSSGLTTGPLAAAALQLDQALGLPLL